MEKQNKIIEKETPAKTMHPFLILSTIIAIIAILAILKNTENNLSGKGIEPPPPPDDGGGLADPDDPSGWRERECSTGEACGQGVRRCFYPCRECLPTDCEPCEPIYSGPGNGVLTLQIGVERGPFAATKFKLSTRTNSGYIPNSIQNTPLTWYFSDNANNPKNPIISGGGLTPVDAGATIADLQFAYQECKPNERAYRFTYQDFSNDKGREVSGALTKRVIG